MDCGMTARQRFAGKVAFITGGAAGLGRAFAEGLAAEGAAVVLADIDFAAAEKAAAELDPSAEAAIAAQCDVADEDSVERAVSEATERLGGVDVLINNAARHLKEYARSFSALTREQIHGLFDVNVLGIVSCSLACRPSMSARGGGVILNMASAAAYTATSPYGVTKVAVRGLTIALANELAGDGIRVNAIAPTMTPTESVLKSYSEEDFERTVAARQLINRRATLADVTNTMLFLCSDDASFITGETIRVTGGAALSI
jgi:NAD(P)-dependent dehydrogenase (short-subunit alcohol dehydrogenase family)